MSERDEWPREITIRATVDTARKYLPEGYNEDNEGDDALLYEIGQTMETLEIESWADIPPGYEPVDDKDREDYDAFRERKRNV